MMQVSSIQTHKMHIRKSEVQNGPSFTWWRHLLYDLSIGILIIMLREIQKEGWSILVNRYISLRKLVQSNIVISNW